MSIKSIFYSGVKNIVYHFINNFIPDAFSLLLCPIITSSVIVSGSEVYFSVVFAGELSLYLGSQCFEEVL